MHVFHYLHSTHTKQLLLVIFCNSVVGIEVTSQTQTKADGETEMEVEILFRG